MADDRDTALLDAELAELWGLPYSYWRAAVNTTYAKTVTESPPGRRTSRLTVSVIARAPGSEDMRVTLTLRRPWGVSYLRRTLVIAPPVASSRSATTRRRSRTDDPVRPTFGNTCA